MSEVCLLYEKSRVALILVMFWGVPLVEQSLRGGPVQRINMKIKRKAGPHEFIHTVGFRIRNPRFHKILMKRIALLEQLKYQPHKLDVIVRKVYRIDLELSRLASILNEEDFKLVFHDNVRSS